MTHVSSLVIENPFYNFTARSDIPELFNLNKPNHEALQHVKKFLEIIRKKKRESAILPIIAEAGYGKTHFYWVLRESVPDAYVVYIPVPTNPNRVYSHFYFETVKAGGAPLLEFIADSLMQKYKGKIEHAAIDYSGLGNIVVEAFFALKDPKQSKIALKWLTGFDLDEETANFKRTILDDEELAFAALKIMLKIVDKPVIFFVDELESLFIALGPEAELQFLETLKKMHNEACNFLLCLACLATLWDKILDLSSTAVQSRIEPPVVLKRFSKVDIEDYSKQMLKEFHQKFEIILSKESALWPLGTADVESAYAFSHGNPREAIKWLASVIEERKSPILKNLESNQLYLNEISKEIKTIVKKETKFSSCVLHRNNGVFVSLSSPEKRFLVALCPKDDLDSVFLTGFSKSLKNVIANEDYDEIILLSETDKDFEVEVPNSVYKLKDIKTKFLKHLKEA